MAPAELRRMTRSQSAPTRSLDKARPCQGLVRHCGILAGAWERWDA